MADKSVTYRQSKLGNENFLPSHRVGVMFTYSLDTTTIFDEMDPSFLQADNSGTGVLNAIASAFTGDPVLSNPVGYGYGSEAQKKGAQLAKGLQEIVVGAGIRSATVEQQINVTQEGALGFYDIVETIDNNVQGNTLSISKMVLRTRLSSNTGLAPWGKDTLTGPRLNAYVFDVKERQRGVDLGFVKVIGLHINSNRFSTNSGQVAMEDVTFRADRIVRVKKVPASLIASLKQQYPYIYNGIEGLEEYVIDDLT